MTIFEKQLCVRVSKQQSDEFNKHAKRFGKPSDVHRDLLQAFIDKKITLSPSPISNLRNHSMIEQLLERIAIALEKGVNSHPTPATPVPVSIPATPVPVPAPIPTDPILHTPDALTNIPTENGIIKHPIEKSDFLKYVMSAYDEMEKHARGNEIGQLLAQKGYSNIHSVPEENWSSLVDEIEALKG